MLCFASCKRRVEAMKLPHSYADFGISVALFGIEIRGKRQGFGFSPQ